MTTKIVYFNNSGAFNYQMPSAVTKIIVEAFGHNSTKQCSIPLTGGYGTTATTATPGQSVYGSGSYARSELFIPANTVIYGNGAYGNVWINTASNSSPTTSTQGVKAVDGGNLSNYTSQQIGQIKYPGGFNGKAYFSYCCTGCATWVLGGQGGAAGPNGPGGNGSSAYTNEDYRVSVSYNRGAGGGANGGTNAVNGTPGLNRWRSTSTGGAGALPCYQGSVDIVTRENVIGRSNANFGPLSGRGGRVASSACGCLNAGGGGVVITAYVPTGSIVRSFDTFAYRYIFTVPGAYTMCAPVGTTSTEVRVLGGGSNGNICNLFFSTSSWRARAGGGGGGYARSTNTTTVTTTGYTVNIYVAPTNSGSTTDYSRVTLNGTIEATAYSASGPRPGGSTQGGAGNTNYARNGITRVGGRGGRGYVGGTTLKGGAGGGAAWEGGNGGDGGDNNNAAAGPGGGGAATCVSAGTLGSQPVVYTGGLGGSYGGGNGGNGGSTNQGCSGGSYPTYTSAYNISGATSVGPGGGGGGAWSSATYSGTGGYGGTFGGGGGGGDTARCGGRGLAVVTFYVCGTVVNNPNSVSGPSGSHVVIVS
jgi:hypothetical protein